MLAGTLRWISSEIKRIDSALGNFYLCRHMDRFNKHFEEIVKYDILYKDRFTNVMQIPKINSIAINTGIGKKAVIDNKHIFTAFLLVELTVGQRPVITRAKKWVDKFQLKKNMPIGCKVTPRHNNMHQFLDRLINRVIPRIEDFRGSLRDRSPSRNTIASTLSGLHDSSAPLSFKWKHGSFTDRSSRHAPSLGPTSTSFGIPDTAVITFSEGQSTQFDQFDTLYGLDIIIVFSPVKNNYLSQPKYLLSASQMPLY